MTLFLFKVEMLRAVLLQKGVEGEGEIPISPTLKAKHLALGHQGGQEGKQPMTCEGGNT